MSHKPRSLIVSIIIRATVVVIALSVCSAIAFALYKTKPAPAVTDAPPAVPRVLVMKAADVPVRRQWTGYGSAAALRTSDVPARVTTTVLRVPENIIEGRRVEAGQLLAELDDSDFARQVEIAAQNLRDIEAQLNRLEVEEQAWQKRLELANEAVELSRGEYDRFVKAFEDGAANQREVDAARQTLISAIRDQVAVEEEFTKIPNRRTSLRAQQVAQEATQRLAKQNVERCTVVSPIAGVLQAVDVEPGENVTIGERIARVVNLETVEIPLRLPAGARAGLEPGDPVELSSTGAFARQWNSTIARINPEDDVATRTMTAYVELQQKPDDTNNLLAPGTYVSGRVTSDLAEPRWIVPRRAIMEGQIRLVENNTIIRRRIETDFQIADTFAQFGLPDRVWVALRDPLPPEALVVVNGATAPPDGATVAPALPESESFAATNNNTSESSTTPNTARSASP